MVCKKYESNTADQLLCLQHTEVVREFSDASDTRNRSTSECNKQTYYPRSTQSAAERSGEEVNLTSH